MLRFNLAQKKNYLTFPLAAVVILASLLLSNCNSGGTTEPDPDPDPSGQDSVITRAALIAEGEVLFDNCSGCHNADGSGFVGSTPPLRYSDYLMAERLRPVRVLLLGLPNAIDTASTITVNGVDYAFQSMPAIGSSFSDTAIASLLTYIRVVLNDSSSTNCRPDPADTTAVICDHVARPEAATDSVTIEEVAAVRDSLIEGGFFCPSGGCD